MSAVDSSGGGVGGGGGDDDPSNQNSSGGGDDNNNKKNNRDRKDPKNWVEVAVSSQRRSSAQSVASSGGGSSGGGGGGRNNVVVNPAEEEGGDAAAAAADPSADEEEDAVAQELYRENLAQATQNSIMETVGAYSVVPGSIPSRRESVGSNDNQQQDSSSGGGLIMRTSSSGGGGAITPTISHDLSNLPMGIDIIAEATLVVSPEDEDYEDNGEDNYEEEYDDDDVDTLGLPHHVSPELGGAVDNDGISVMSAMTNPTTMQDARTISSHIIVPESSSARVVAPAILDDEEAQHHIMATATVESATGETHDVSASTSSVDASVTANSSSQQQQQQPLNLGTIYEAEIVEDGPMNILRSKSGRVMCTVAVAIILTLSLGLALGLTLGRQGGGGGGEGRDQEYVITPPDPNEVLNHAGGNFCNAVTPIVSFDQYPSHCTADEVMLGGTIQQAVAIAQRRPHPYCVEVEEGPPSWHVCSVTNVTPQISLVNGGAVRGEIATGSPITRRLVSNILPFTSDTVSYLQLLGSDVIKVLENAIGYVTQEVPLNPYLQGAYPYASGLKFSVDLMADDGSNKVSNVQVLSSRTGEYVPIDESSSYWIVTNEWIANGGDGYLTDVTPKQVVPTKLSYTSRLEDFLTELDGYWEPPVMPDEMSTVSFNAEGIPVASIADVEPIPET